MRTLLIYMFFAVALWYLGRAAMRHYLSSQQSGQQPGKGAGRNDDPGRVKDRTHGNYESARDARYRDLE